MSSNDLEDQLDREVARVEAHPPKDKPDSFLDEPVEKLLDTPKEDPVDAPKPDPTTEDKPEPELPPVKKKNWLKRILTSKKMWFTLLGLLIVVGSFVWLIRPSRMYIVNQLGLTANLTITTQTLPENKKQKSSVLKNVTVKINGTPHMTDQNGTLQLQVPYGYTTIVTEKPGYDQAEKKVVVDFDPFFYYLGGREQDEKIRTIKLQLRSVGIPLSFNVTDWLTGSPLTIGKFSMGDIVAEPDDKGKVSLTVPATDNKQVSVKATFGGKYVSKTLVLDLKPTEPRKPISFVPAGKHYFISKRSGNYGVYSSNVDGSKVTKIIAPSANETSDVSFAVSPGGKFAAFASTRDGLLDERQEPLQKLYVVDLATQTLTPVDRARSFDFVDWSGDTLVYQSNIYSASTGEVSKRMSSVDVTNRAKKILSTAQSFGETRVGLGMVAYLGTYAEATDELRVVSVKGGTQKKLGEDIQRMSQTDYDRITYQTSDNAWHEFNLNTQQAKNSSAPSSLVRGFLGVTSPDGQSRLISERVDGTQTLLLKSVATGKEKKLTSLDNLQGPVAWVGATLVFRVSDDTHTADYVISLKGGKPKKIIDVSGTATNGQGGYFGFY